MQLWPHQTKGIADVFAAIESGHKEIVLTSPTGAGKTLMMVEMSKVFSSQGKKVALYTHRIKLTQQALPRFVNAGLTVGVRASGFANQKDDNADVQICSFQTERLRVIKRRLKHTVGGEYAKRTFPLVKADVVFVDEAHMMRSPTMLGIIDEHIELGTTVILVTATPVGMKRENSHLIVAGKNSELRECGALLRAKYFAPDELDARFVKRSSNQEFLINGRYRKIWLQRVIGKIVEHWKRMNKDRLPTIGFAPSVQDSLGLAKEFHEQGVISAHVDAKNIWIQGKEIPSNKDNWLMLVDMIERGKIEFVSNRFVLREGIDLPIFYQAIFATPVASFKSYIQAAGRVLRNYPGYDHVLITDHAGNWWRHLSPNADHDWHELFDADEYKVSKELQEKYADNKEPEPICCPKCFALRISGAACRECGFKHEQSSRRIVQLNGTLKEVTGKANKKQEVVKKTETEKQWQSIYYRMLNASKKGKLKTFSQAYGLFQYTYHYKPPRDLPLMPKNSDDWKSYVTSVPRKDLL